MPEPEIITQNNPAAEAAPKKRGRPPKKAPRTRRKRPEQDYGALTIPEAIQNKATRDGMELRWINDLPQRRVEKLVNDDWDPVDGMERIHGGNHKDDGLFKMVLCQKPKEFLAEDRARKENERLEKYAGYTRGHSKEDAMKDGNLQFTGEETSITRKSLN